MPRYKVTKKSSILTRKIGRKRTYDNSSRKRRSNNFLRIGKTPPIRRGRKKVIKKSKKYTRINKISKDQNFGNYLSRFLSNHPDIDQDESVKYGKNNLRDEFKALKRKYKFITPGLFVYSEKSEKRKKFSKIIAYYLIYDDKSGYSLFKIFFRREKQNENAWMEFMLNLEYKGVNEDFEVDPEYQAETIFKEKVLDVINSHRETNYTMKALLCYGIPRSTDKDLFHGRYQKHD
jgi:hypothetical protein